MILLEYMADRASDWFGIGIICACGSTYLPPGEVQESEICDTREYDLNSIR